MGKNKESGQKLMNIGKIGQEWGSQKKIGRNNDNSRTVIQGEAYCLMS